MKKTFIILGLVVLGLVALDQITKYLIVQNLELREEIVIIKNFFTITSHRNDGAAWGILDGNMPFFYAISVFAAGLFYWMLKDINVQTQKLYLTAVILMISGGIGNFIDRLLFQEVVDFIDIDLWSYTTFPVFNIADICLVVGMIVFILDIILEEVRKRGNNQSNV